MFRNQGWSECLVSNAEERWLGRGSTDDEALESALGQMLPSQLAREAFDAHLARTIAITIAATSSDEPAIEPLVEAVIAPADVEPTAAPEEASLAEPSEISPAIEGAAPSLEPLVEAPIPAEPVASTTSAEAAATALALADALAALDKMLHDIDAQLPAVAKKSAEQQRLHLLVWICQARAFEEAWPEARPVPIAVQRIARRLGEIGKMLWPGSVRALQLATSPADTMEPHAAEAPPTTWAQAAERAELRRREHILKATSAGFDADGWMDTTAGAPPPNPGALLAQAVADLDALLARSVDASTEEHDVAALVRIAQVLRWTRRSATDHLAWGIAMGRLRRRSTSLGTHGVTLRKTIDPTYKPPSTWVPAVAAPTEGALSKERSDKLVTELASLGRGEDTLLPWLLRAFDAFPTPALAEMLRPRRDQAMALGELAGTYEDRRIRRRLRDLLQRLATGGVEEAPPSARRALRSKEEEEPESGDDSALQQLCDRVRPHTQGRRVLFASNRADDKLEARLTELLGVRMTGCDSAPRRLQSQCERIAQGSYDLVLSATGFQDHAMDSALAKATSAARIPYVRVNRGRPLACAQAIARELGESIAIPSKGSSRQAVRAG